MGDLGVVIGFDHHLVIGADQDEGSGYFTNLVGTHAGGESHKQESRRDFFHGVLSAWGQRLHAPEWVAMWCSGKERIRI